MGLLARGIGNKIPSLRRSSYYSYLVQYWKYLYSNRDKICLKLGFSIIMRRWQLSMVSFLLALRPYHKQPQLFRKNQVCFDLKTRKQKWYVMRSDLDQKDFRIVFCYFCWVMFGILVSIFMMQHYFHPSLAQYRLVELLLCPLLRVKALSFISQL